MAIWYIETNILISHYGDYSDSDQEDATDCSDDYNSDVEAND